MGDGVNQTHIPDPASFQKLMGFQEIYDAKEIITKGKICRIHAKIKKFVLVCSVSSTTTKWPKFNTLATTNLDKC